MIDNENLSVKPNATMASSDPPQASTDKWQPNDYTKPPSCYEFSGKTSQFLGVRNILR